MDVITVFTDIQLNGIDHPQSPPEALLADFGGGIPPSRRAEDCEGPERTALFCAEEGRLREIAQSRGLLDSVGDLIPVSPDDGREHRVAYNPATDGYLKTTHPGSYGGYMGIGYELDFGTQRWVERPMVLQATPREYLARLCLANDVFQDDIVVSRVVQDRAGLSIETSQPAISGRPATPPEIKCEMEELGFREVHPDGIFYRDRDHVLVWDLEGNCLITSDGDFAPIDAMLRTAPFELVAQLSGQP